MKSRIQVSLLAMILFFGAALASDGTRMISFSTRMLGRGGTSIGLFDSPALMMTNPAGISFVQRDALEVNCALLVPTIHFQNGLNDANGKANIFPLPSVAFVQTNQENRLSWGIGAFTQGGMGADFSLNHNLYRTQSGQFIPQDYHSKFAVMQGGPSVAYKLTPAVSIGATAHLVYGQLEFSMPYSLAPSVMKGVINPGTGMTFGDMFAAPAAQGGFGYREVTASAQLTGLTALGFEGKLGLAYKVSKDLSFGLSYTSSSALTFKNGKATMDMTAQLNDAFSKAIQGYMFQNPASTQQQAQAAIMQQFTQLGIDLSKGVVAQYDLENKMKLPQSVGIGGSIRATDQLLLALDVEWLNWANAFDKMTLNLSNGNNANINRMLGNNGSFSVDFPLEWKNSVSLHVGGEYMVNDRITGRVGYAYGSNPVPEQTVFPVFPAIVENHLMLGASVKLSEALSIDLAYETALNKTETASTVSKVASEYSGSTSQLSENVFHVALSWGL